ncbi:MAG: hypothetical protein IIZ66_01480 [Clostridia bacterium]|nr:hypothetical protein [Clostridia bacterium]
MSRLDKIDSAAEAKGAGVKTFWQFVKFIFVSLLAMIVQFALLNLLAWIFKSRTDLYNVDFGFWVFDYPAGEKGGLGYFIASNTANIVAQIVSFFVNREKTFKSGANVAVTLPIYIAFTVFLIFFSAWLNPSVYGAILPKVGDVWARNIATMTCSCVQFFAYFPVDKLLFRKPKAEKAG